MKKQVRSIIAILLTGAMALSAVGCSAHPEDSGESRAMENQTVTDGRAEADHLMTVWSDYLGVLNQMYESELWVLDYVSSYLDTGDWTDLTKARTACIVSAGYLTERSMSEDDLSEEEYLSLANAGVDTGYQSAEFSSLDGAIDEAHSVIRNRLLESLECDVFNQNSIEILKEEIAVQRDYIHCMCSYICNETNYLLLSLGDEAVSDNYWSSMQENYPTLASGGIEWFSTENEVKTAGDECLDEYEEINLKQSDLIASMNADLYRMSQNVQNGDWESMTASAHTMTNVPALLPMPEWYKPETAGYLGFVSGGDGSISYPESGDTLPDAGYGMYIQIKDIQETDIVDYMAVAEPYADLCWREDDSTVWYIAMPGYNIKIDWKDDIATILFNGEDITFAPGWYIGLQ